MRAFAVSRDSMLPKGRRAVWILIAAAVGVVGAAPGSVAMASSADPTPAQVRAVLARLQIAPRTGDRAFTIPSSAMEPTLHCARPGVACLGVAADRIITRPYSAGKPRRGEIVAFTTPPLALVRCGAGGTFIKRVIGLPGETFEERNGFVYINGRRIKEPYVKADERDSRSMRVRVPSGRYFVVGDNRSASCDSRSWGTVPTANIIGRAIAVYWPAARARRL
jgi:signal peptidase I